MKIIFKTSIAGPNYSYKPNERAEIEDEKAIRFIKAGIAKPSKEKEVEYPHHTGGGWYETSDGRKIQGKEKAMAAERGLVE